MGFLPIGVVLLREKLLSLEAQLPDPTVHVYTINSNNLSGLSDVPLSSLECCQGFIALLYR